MPRAGFSCPNRSAVGRAACLSGSRPFRLVSPPPGCWASIRATPPPAISQYQFASSPSALFAVSNQIGVVDTFNNRLMLFPPVEQWNLNNFFQAAIAVVGQTTFSTGTANQALPSAGPTTLADPVGVFVYNSALYVADAGNNRMIVLPQNGSGFGPATAVLGQFNLTLNTVNLIEGREFDFSAGADAGMAMDFSSAVPHLYISDPANNRILGFYDLRNIQPGQYADIVIGQPDFLHSVSNYPNNQPTSNNLSIPTGLVVDSLGNLYVADTGNGRVLRFPSPFANFQPGTPAAVTESADLVLGQLNFTTKITDATSQTMGAPYGLAFDPPWPSGFRPRRQPRPVFRGQFTESDEQPGGFHRVRAK